jgi:hypothetical protein
LDLGRVPSLRYLWCVDSLPNSLLQQLQDMSKRIYSPLAVLNLHTTPNDMILTGIISSVSPLRRDSIIGCPLATTHVLLLHTKTQTAVPLGAVGDLYISGADFPSGYLNRPDLDTAALLLHPVYGRLFKTGERGRLVKNSEGKLEVDLLKESKSVGGISDQEEVAEESVNKRDSVASIVDSFTEASVFETEKKIDLAEANVLSLIGKTCV